MFSPVMYIKIPVSVTLVILIIMFFLCLDVINHGICFMLGRSDGFLRAIVFPTYQDRVRPGFLRLIINLQKGTIRYAEHWISEVVRRKY